MIKFKLIDEFRSTWHRLWSIRFAVAGLAMTTGEQVLPMLGSMPAQLAAMIPSWLPTTFFILAALSRVVKQEKLSG